MSRRRARPAWRGCRPASSAAIKTCEADWCRLETDSYDGWLKRDEFWGVYPGEAVE